MLVACLAFCLWLVWRACASSLSESASMPNLKVEALSPDEGGHSTSTGSLPCAGLSWTLYTVLAHCIIRGR
jgi:hypothetical protein